VAQARTRLARAAVVDAARTLFLERGYGATTIEAISARSDVPPATVYRLFSSKRGILKVLLHVSIAGDDEAVPMANRPPVRSLLPDPDPMNMVAGFAGVAAQVNSRTAAIHRILVSAAASDPDAAALLDELTRQRQQGQGRSRFGNLLRARREVIAEGDETIEWVGSSRRHGPVRRMPTRPSTPTGRESALRTSESIVSKSGNSSAFPEIHSHDFPSQA
jgi:AcrR family transcriptional regulator